MKATASSKFDRLVLNRDLIENEGMRKRPDTTSMTTEAESSEIVLNRFVYDWDETIATWFSNPVGRDELAQMDRLLFRIDPSLMPEPYWGNPLDCSIVLANLNPGGSGEPNWNTSHGRGLRWFMDHTKEHGYSSFAKTGPVFMCSCELERRGWDCFRQYNGWKWWYEKKGRRQWASRIADGLQALKKHCPKEGKKPFALEICGWHSAGWIQNVSALANREPELFRSRVVAPLLSAVKMSDCRVGLCVGRPWSDLLRTTDAFGTSLFGFRSFPETYRLLNDGSDRKHELFETEDGCRILVSWQSHRTSEKPDNFLPPDASFLKSELSFLEGNRDFPTVTVPRRS